MNIDKLSKEELSQRARELAQVGHSKMTPEQRKARAQKALKVRWAKAKKAKK